MTEEYKGIKFHVVAIKKTISEEAIGELVETDHMLGEFLSPEANEGNLSMRYGNGFLIKKAGSRLTTLEASDVVFVEKVQGDRVFATGEASSEAMMHYEIYCRRADAVMILHFHNDKFLDMKFQYEVGPLPYGTKQLADAVAEAAVHTDLIKIERHGFVIIAKNKEKLRERLARFYQ
jgi:ribulose-5-phosphate 4-epimerase/fuculose-1-phosphate aldolase